jgi:putative tryptophan/tyrosine transport system substrate-binding protein
VLAPLTRRRGVLVGLAAALFPSWAPAHKPATPPRIGWFSAGSEPDPFLERFREGLRKLGYVEGQNIALETRHAQGDLGGQTGRPSDRATHEVRAGHQPQDGERARADRPAVAPAARRSGDPVSYAGVET